jgi:hypothetical protein
MGAITLSRLAAWLGLVPRQATTGGKPKLLGITKRGSKYLRKLIIRAGHGNTQVIKPMPTPSGSRLPPRRSISSAKRIKNDRL